MADPGYLAKMIGHSLQTKLVRVAIVGAVGAVMYALIESRIKDWIGK